MAGRENVPFRRIVIALDASASSRAAMIVAARIAAGLRQELAAMFIEDADLFSVSALPFSREVRLGAKTPSVIDPAQLERELRERAETLRKELESVARSLSVRWSFDVVRSRMESAMTSVAGDEDLIAVTRSFESFFGRRGPIGMGPKSTPRSYSALLIVGPEVEARPGPVTVAFDGSDDAKRALDVAARLAESEKQRLIIMLFNRGDSEGVESAAKERLEGISRVDFRRVAYGNPEDLIALLCRRERGLLVLHENTAPLAGQNFERVLRSASCPVLLLRSAGSKTSQIERGEPASSGDDVGTQ